MTYYNEFDPKAAAWLRELIRDGHIPAGDVDERSISDIRPGELARYSQQHFFAGIGGWAFALRLAGWPDERPVRTGSCPCQPFSAAGKGLGEADERHLWPDFLRIIRGSEPCITFGEQVASSSGRDWLSGTNQGLPLLRYRKELLSILYELEGRAPLDVRELHDIAGTKEEAVQFATTCHGHERVASHESGDGAMQCSEIPSEGEGYGILFGPRSDTGSDRSWRLRGDRDSIRAERAPRMERSVAGPGRLFTGLHDGEHPCCFVCGERHGEHVGRPEDCPHWPADLRNGAKPQQILAGSLGLSPEEEAWLLQLSGVRADLEGLGYAVGASDLCSAGVGSPNIRQRLFWMAHADSGKRDGVTKREGRERNRPAPERNEGHGQLECRRIPCGLAYANGGQSRDGDVQRGGQHGQQPQDGGTVRMDDSTGNRRKQGTKVLQERRTEPSNSSNMGFWAAFSAIPCTDGKTRRIEPGSFPLAHGVSGRVGLLRGYGNAINPWLAAEFILACEEAVAGV